MSIKNLSFFIFALVTIFEAQCFRIGSPVRKGSCTSKSLSLFSMTMPKYENIDSTGLVAITSQCMSDTCDEVFEYHKFTCFGFLIHPKIVLTLSNCVPQSQAVTFVKVRAYHWNKNENQINDNTPYNSQDVSEIIFYPQNNPRFPRKKLNNLAAVILSRPLNVYPLFELANKTNADLNHCAIIDSDGEINDEDVLDLDQFSPRIYESSESGFKNCFIKNKRDLSFDKTFCAFTSPDSFCGGNLGNPYMCRSLENDKKHLLKGILIDREGQHSAYLNTDDISSWIGSIKSSHGL
ncbi:uncharacterized protein LOC130669564 [Microplitis mediator]|uniref:uncharacterized protein LOC130669564 n=1 Tax=Microplitis mediator TaxID=375433 RepID=UPI00255726CD|nr:uncharacterized protein LOC130669564 [Microplitis mediator]